MSDEILTEIKTSREFRRFTRKNLGILELEKYPDGIEFKATDGEWYFVSSPEAQKWVLERFQPQTNTLANPDDEYANNLVYGSEKTRNVVSVEVKDSEVYIYTETPEGVELEQRPIKHYFLTDVKPLIPHTRLSGDLHFKYLTEFGTAEEKQRAVGQLIGKYGREGYRNHLFNLYDPREEYMVRNGMTYFKGMSPSDVSILSFDIETNKTLDPTLPHSKTLLISNTLRKAGKITRKLFALDEYKNELSMILAWCKYVREVDPSVMIGHNIFRYDTYYLHNRVRITSKTQIADGQTKKMNILGLPLGRDGSIMTISKSTSEFRVDGTNSYDYHKVKIFGRELIDSQFMAVRYDIGREFTSYGLKPLEEALGIAGENRIIWDWEKHNPDHIWRTLYEGADFFTMEEAKKLWTDFKQYCMEDSDSPIELYDIMIPAYFYLMNNLPISFQNVYESASGSQINRFLIRGYIQNQHSIPKPSEVPKYQGAISYGNPGIYRNVRKLDVASLYPSIMIQHKIYDEKKDPLKLFLETVETFTNQRLEHKAKANETGEKYYRDMEQAEKIMINSMYGFMGARGLHFNSPENAALVTKHGREILSKAVRWASGREFEHVIKKQTAKKTSYHWILEKQVEEGNGYIIPNVDTDAFSFAKPDLTPISDEEFKEITDKVNSLFPDHIIWEDDGSFDTFVVMAAKNYMMEYYDPKKDKVVRKLKGSSITDQKKELKMLEMIQKIAQYIFDKREDELLELYHQYIDEARNLTNIKEWCQKKSVSKAILNAATDPAARTNEKKPWEAIQHKNLQEGDKFWVYPKKGEDIQKFVKGEPVFYKKTGEPKMVENIILKSYDEYENDEHTPKLLERVYATIKIFDSILDMGEFLDYSKPKNLKLLEEKE